MAASGTEFEGPSACPFVALELDRDRRSDKPDYRHRCFAEPTPAPRSLAHQEAYCLSPKFAACPIFQDWAVRAAARPTAASTPTTVAGVAAAGAAAAAGMAGTESIEPPPEEMDEPAGVAPESDAYEPAPEPATEEVTPLDAVAPAAAAFGASAADPGASAWRGVHDNEQLGAFDGPAAAEAPRSSFGEPDAGYQEPPESPEIPVGYVPPPAQRDSPPPPYGVTIDEEPDIADAAVPAFLAGRSARPTQPAPLPPPHMTDKVAREEIVPSWEIDGRYGAESGEEPRGNRMDSLLTAVAVIVILGLGVAGVIFLPGLLAGSPGRTPTPSFGLPTAAPSFAQPSAPASSAPTIAPATSEATVAPPSASVEPAASPRLYRIKSGDTMAKIAKRFKVSVADILAANPQIQDANHIEVGQVIVIPSASGATPAP